MNIIFCDGSTKIHQKCVVTSCLVATMDNEHIVTQVIFCAKQVYENYYHDSIHELLAIKDALLVIELLQLDNCLVVSDSVEVIKVIEYFRKEQVWHGKNHDCANEIQNMINTDKTIDFLWLPRTTLGLNVVDFLNKEKLTWTNSKDAPFLKSQMKKLLKKSYDYNISSKKLKM